MKIVTKDNFGRDLFVEEVVAENVNEHIGKQLVDRWNSRYWTEHSQEYLKLVPDDYKPYNGYEEHLG